MKSKACIWRSVGILSVLLLFLTAGIGANVASRPVLTTKKQEAAKQSDAPAVTVAEKAGEAVVPVFMVKLCGQVFVTSERYFHIVADERPRHPDTYPIFRSGFFANIFSNAIAINAP